jgi:hypothetical protein
MLTKLRLDYKPLPLPEDKNLSK